MTKASFTLIDEQQPHEIDAVVKDGRVRISTETVRDVLGWKLEPRGLCRGEVCIPVKAGDGLEKDASGIDLASLAAKLDRPLALDAEQRAAALAAPAAQRSSALASLEAPDFTLPDLDGNMHSLSQLRGKKVLLIAYASW